MSIVEITTVTMLTVMRCQALITWTISAQHIHGVPLDWDTIESYNIVSFFRPPTLSTQSPRIHIHIHIFYHTTQHNTILSISTKDCPIILDKYAIWSYKKIWSICDGKRIQRTNSTLHLLLLYSPFLVVIFLWYEIREIFMNILFDIQIGSLYNVHISEAWRR